MEKKEGGEKLCACVARHLGGSGGMLPRENFSALSFNLVQTEGKYAVGKNNINVREGQNDTRGGGEECPPPRPPFNISNLHLHTSVCMWGLMIASFNIE